MTGDPDRWIVIPRWDGPEGFQHYKDRDPRWIKNYRDLLSKDEYRDLTLVQRGVLHGLWLEYAASNRQLRDSTLAITRRLGQRVTRATLDSLNHAGFIAYSASKPLSPSYHSASLEEETEREEETEKTLNQNQGPLTLNEEQLPATTNGQHNDPLHISQAIAASLAKAAGRVTTDP